MDLPSGCSPIASISTCTKRLSPASRSISSTERSGDWIGSTAEPARRLSLASHSAASQSLSARAKAAARFSSRKNCTGNSELQMAWAKPKRSSVACAVLAGSVSAPALRQSGRAVSGAFGG